MIKYYNNRELSRSLNINLARWKRWTREFLPPDPLGGLQSGYARQLSMREAFWVALGGHLVGFLKFSIHQAKTILADLEPWLEQSGYFQWNAKSIKGNCIDEKNRATHCIYLRSTFLENAVNDEFYYAICQCPSLSPTVSDLTLNLNQTEQIVFINTPDKIQKNFTDSPFLVLLCIGRFRRFFLNHLHPLK
jgi:hypothetical protein